MKIADLLDARFRGHDTNDYTGGPMPQVRANGIDIEYESFGRESDPLILLIMGFGAQLIFWPESLCEGLAAKGFRVVRFDNRDVGKSTHLAGQTAPDPRALFAEVMAGRRPHVPYSLDDMANDAVGLMDALGTSAPISSAPRWAA